MLRLRSRLPLLMLTKDDLAAIQDANHLVPWRLVVVDFKQLCSASMTCRHMPDTCRTRALLTLRKLRPTMKLRCRTTIRITPRSGAHHDRPHHDRPYHNLDHARNQRTLLRKSQKPLTGLSFGHVEVFLPDPPKQPHPLGEDGVTLQIVRRDRLGGDELRGECAGGGQRGAEAGEKAKAQTRRHDDARTRRHDDTTTRGHDGGRAEPR